MPRLQRRAATHAVELAHRPCLFRAVFVAGVEALDKLLDGGFQFAFGHDCSSGGGGDFCGWGGDPEPGRGA